MVPSPTPAARRSTWLLALVLAGASACTDTLPVQDRRIRGEVPIAKMSVDDLWKDFQQDAAGARSRYHGKAVEISGKPTRADGQDSGGAYLLFAQSGELGDEEVGVRIANFTWAR